MKTTLLHEDSGQRTFLLVMDKEDEAFSQITAFAADHQITAASITAIGACSSVTLGYFDPDVSDYRQSSFDEQLEIVSFIGGIAEEDGKPALHAHVVLGRRDFSTLAGHLMEMTIFPTMEIVLTENPAHLRKHLDRETGLTLISPADSTSAQ